MSGHHVPEHVEHRKGEDQAGHLNLSATLQVLSMRNRKFYTKENIYIFNRSNDNTNRNKNYDFE